MNPREERASNFDGCGEDVLLEARRLARAGEPAARANPLDGICAFGVVCRAIEGRLELVERWVEAEGQEVPVLRAVREDLREAGGATGS